MAEKTPKEIIESGEWADCWICSDAFRRRRQTKRYCAICHKAFCEGEHGNFSRGIGMCVICGTKKSDKK